MNAELLDLASECEALLRVLREGKMAINDEEKRMYVYQAVNHLRAAHALLYVSSVLREKKQ